MHFPFGAVGSINFRNGKMNGWSMVNYQDRVILLSLYYDDKIDGTRVIYESSEQLWVSSRYSL